jgi:putative transposase
VVHGAFMPRRARVAPGGQIYHIMNRASGDLLLFDGPASYRSFIHLVAEAAEVTGMRILAFCVMPNHWHLVVWPRNDADLRRFVQRFTIRHAHSWHVRNGSVGRGHLYQGRYKSFPVGNDSYLLTVCRYVERNPVRALLVGRAEDWPWSSASWRARDGSPAASVGQIPMIRLVPMRVDMPRDWLRWVNDPQTEAELHRLRLHVRSGALLADGEAQDAGGRSGPLPTRTGVRRPAGRRSTPNGGSSSATEPRNHAYDDSAPGIRGAHRSSEADVDATGNKVSQVNVPGLEGSTKCPR